MSARTPATHMARSVWIRQVTLSGRATVGCSTSGTSFPGGGPPEADSPTPGTPRWRAVESDSRSPGPPAPQGLPPPAAAPRPGTARAGGSRLSDTASPDERIAMDRALAPEADHLALDVRGMVFDALATGPEDGPLVLFLHGFPEFASCWREQIAAAARAGYRAVAVDQRGYSPGARPEGPAAYTVDELVADVFGFADALQAERFHLVGHDWGGVLAWPATGRRPERIRTLTVLSTPHPRALARAVAESEEQRESLSYIGLFRREGKAEE